MSLNFMQFDKQIDDFMISPSLFKVTVHYKKHILKNVSRN